MDKEFNWLVDVFLGTSDKIAPPMRPVPGIPVLDENPALRKGRDGSSDDLVEEIERGNLIEMLAPIPADEQINRDVARFSPEPKPEPGLEFVKHVLDAQLFTEEVLPTTRILAEWTPAAQAMVADLIKSAQKKVCKLRYGWKDGSISCCPIDLGDGNYQDQKTNKVFNFLRDCETLQACTDHCEVTA